MPRGNMLGFKTADDLAGRIEMLCGQRCESSSDVLREIVERSLMSNIPMPDGSGEKTRTFYVRMDSKLTASLDDYCGRYGTTRSKAIRHFVRVALGLA